MAAGIERIVIHLISKFVLELAFQLALAIEHQIFET